MYYTYQNIPVLINNNYMFASQLGLNIQASIDPIYLTENRHSFGYSPSNGLQSSLKITYYMTGEDFVKKYIDNERTVLSGNIAGLYFNSGYLKSYNINCSPNSPVEPNIEIVFFEELKGNFCAYFDIVSSKNILNFGNIEISQYNTGIIGFWDTISNVNYSFNSDIRPVYKIGDYQPSEINFGIKTISMDIETDNTAPDMPIYGKQAGARLNFRHPQNTGLNENLTCSGILYSRNFSTQESEYFKNTLSITQNYIESPPIITGFNPTTGSPLGYITIYGSNLINTKKISFYSLQEKEIESQSFKIISDNEVYVQIPKTKNETAFTGPVTLENHYGKITTGTILISIESPSLM